MSRGSLVTFNFIPLRRPHSRCRGVRTFWQDIPWYSSRSLRRWSVCWVDVSRPERMLLICLWLEGLSKRRSGKPVHRRSMASSIYKHPQEGLNWIESLHRWHEYSQFKRHHTDYTVITVITASKRVPQKIDILKSNVYSIVISRSAHHHIPGGGVSAHF